MEKRWQKQTDSFPIYDCDGKRYQIMEYTDYVTIESYGKPPEEREVLKSYMTIDGMRVTKIDDNTFEIHSLELKKGTTTIIAKRR